MTIDEFVEQYPWTLAFTGSTPSPIAFFRSKSVADKALNFWKLEHRWGYGDAAAVQTIDLDPAFFPGVEMRWSDEPVQAAS